MSESHKGEKNSMFGRLGKDNPNYGFKHSEETRKKMSKSQSGQNHPMFGKLGKDNPNYGSKRSEETKRKISVANSGRILSIETRKKMSEFHKGTKLSEEIKRKISESHKGEKNPMFGRCREQCPSWQNGKSFEEYGTEFNKELKDRIRKRDNGTCQECSKKQIRHKLDVHHIDYNKKNNKETNLISLCKKCHGKTNFERKDWTKYFKKKIKNNIR